MLSTIRAFFKNERKRLLTLLCIGLVYQVLATGFIYQLDAELAAKSYKQFGGLYLHSLRVVIEFVFTYYLLIFHACLPLLKDRKKGWQFLLVTLFVFTVKFGYATAFDYEHMDYQVKESGSEIARFILEQKFLFFTITSLIGYFFVLAICLVVAFIIDFNIRTRRQKELEKQKIDAELSAIKYQINPHFLFNSLSFIYSKTVPLSEEVSNAVLLLSDIMRYALGKEEDAEGKVDLAKEVIHMKNVIAINQMRFNNKLNILYSEQLTKPDARITPLVLITLVENAFKHGDLLDPANPLVIRLESGEGKIHFFIRNKKKQGPKELSTGIGLNNVRQRLQLMYGDKFTFTTLDNEHFYTTELSIHD